MAKSRGVEIVKFAQALIFIHATISAVHGILQYSEAFGLLVEKKLNEKAAKSTGDNVTHIRPM